MVGIKIKAIDGSVKKLTLVKNPYDRRDYKYKLKERMVSRKEAIDACLKVLDGNELTREEICQQSGLDKIHIHNILQKMRDYGLVRFTSEKKNGKRLYTKHYECLLAEHLYPSPEEIEKQFTIKGRTVRKLEQGGNRRSGYGSNVTYSKSYSWDME